MIKVVVDRTKFESSHRQILADLTDPNKVLRTALTNLHALISERAQIFGQLTNGQRILGYSTGWEKVRRKHGRQVGHVDLTFSGDMFRNFNIYPIRNGFGLGFGSKAEFDKMEWLTDQKGVFILPSEQEKDLAAKDIIKAAQNVAKRNR